MSFGLKVDRFPFVLNGQMSRRNAMEITITSNLQMESDCGYKISVNKKAYLILLLVLRNENEGIER